MLEVAASQQSGGFSYTKNNLYKNKNINFVMFFHCHFPHNNFHFSHSVRACADIRKILRLIQLFSLPLHPMFAPG
jgi:hypothetical protein